MLGIMAFLLFVLYCICLVALKMFLATTLPDAGRDIIFVIFLNF